LTGAQGGVDSVDFSEQPSAVDFKLGGAVFVCVNAEQGIVASSLGWLVFWCFHSLF